MLAIIGASGKLAFSTLQHLLSHTSLPATSITCTTRSPPGSPTYLKLSSLGCIVKQADFNDPPSLRRALEGCTTLFLVSTPEIELDYNDAPPRTGRESRHITAIEIAREVGITRVFYTSLAFGRPSKAGVMRAHVRTEEYLESLTKDGDGGLKYTVIREGLYNESWPLYLGYYDVDSPEGDNRGEIVLAGDGPISWTAIEDLGLGTALILSTEGDDYVGKTVYLSTRRNVMTVADVAGIVGRVRGRELKVKLVEREEHERIYIEERDMPGDAVRWWSSTYDALKDNECLIDDGLLDRLLESKGKVPKTMEETIKEMLSTKR